MVDSLSVLLGGHPALREVSLELTPGAYGVVLGPSGAGKSTLLRAVAGLVEATGRVRIGDRLVCAGEQVVPPEERPVGFLFQGLALWSHMTVEQHLRYALRGRRVPREEHETRIKEILDVLGIARLRGRHPGDLSGGERQRLALARAMVSRPQVLLLDEPTSSVDPQVARDVRELLLEVNRRYGTTVVHVTHDQEEALALGERVVILDRGEVIQEGTPEEVYEQPTNRRAAAFVGEGGVLPATMRPDGRADSPLGVVQVRGFRGQGPLWLLVRPDDLEAVSAGGGIPARVERASYAGGRFRARLELDGHSLAVDLEQRPPDGERVRVRAVRPLWGIEEREP